MRGILPEYTKLIADQLGRTLSMVVAPKLRIHEYIKKSDIDINCYSNPEWVKRPSEFYWSETLFNKKEVIFGPKPMPKNLQGLEGKTLGTVLGYKYPKLDPYFDTKKILREDAPNEEANLKKLKSSYISYIVIDDYILNITLKAHPSLGANRDTLLVQEYPIQCLLNKNSGITLAQLNHAIEQIKASNKLQEIFDKYSK